MCLGLLRRLQLWIEWKSGDEPAAGVAHAAAGWDLQVSAGRHDQPETGLHVERNADSAIEREQWILDQD